MRFSQELLAQIDKTTLFCIMKLLHVGPLVNLLERKMTYLQCSLKTIKIAPLQNLTTCFNNT